MRSPSIPLLVLLLGVGCVQACSESSKGEDQSRVGGGSPNGGGAPSSTSSAPSTGASLAQGGAITAATTPTNGGRGAASGGSTATGGDRVATGGGSADAGGSSGSGGTVLGTLSSRASSGGTKARSSARGGASESGGTSIQGDTRSSGGTSTTASSRSSGGSSGGKNACGTAAEDASVTLSCPQGQVIDAVVFASYGTPTGTCGGFVVGSCDASSSKATVESLCTGRRSCTVPATNSAFGDPCSRTTKQLAVEVACVVGTPVVTPETPYKGVANSPASQIAALGATWCYNWGTTPKSTDCADPYFVPMVWGGGDVAGAIKAIGNAGYTTVLGFNEPNKKDQANMSVAEAIALWPTLTSNSSIRVGSPAVSDDGRAWLQDFMTQVKSKGLRVDFIAMHWYGWNAGSCVASQLEGAVKWASQWGLPIWITEFGCMGSSNSDAQTVLEFFDDAIPMLDKHPLVERYAWYPWNTYNELYQSNAMTELGKAFAAAPQYRQ